MRVPRTAFLGVITGAAAAITASRIIAPRTFSTARAQTDLRQAEKATADELDKELLEQLHAATLKASDSCFEIKKFCATVLVPTGSLVALFSDRRLNTAAFASGVLVVLFFWLADAVSYYYQRKLRVSMDAIWRRRAERLTEPWTPPRTAPASAMRSAFNGSMYFYLLLAIPIFFGLFLYTFGIVESPARVSP